MSFPSDPAAFRSARGFRPWMAIAPAAVLVTGALAAVALDRMPLPGGSPIDPANAIQISLIQPVEPDIVPGDTMEVGELVDGYTHVAAAPVAEVDRYEDGYASAWVEPQPEPEPERVAWREREEEEPVLMPTAAQPEAARAANPYGFDAPRPDYAAAREARRARMEQRQTEGWREVPAGARLSADSAFY